jgi:hypothetical protein
MDFQRLALGNPFFYVVESSVTTQPDQRFSVSRMSLVEPCYARRSLAVPADNFTDPRCRRTLATA